MKRTQQIKASVAAAVLGVLSPLAMVMPASAATKTWIGHHPVPSDAALASVGYNWVDGVVPLSGDAVVFPVGGINQIIEFDAAHEVGDSDATSSVSLASIVFNGARTGTSSKDYVLSSDFKIKLSGNIESVMTGSGGNQAVKTSVALQTDSTFKTAGSSALTVGDTDTVLDLGAKTLTLDAGGGSISLVGKIAGTGNIVKAGSGKVNMLTTPGTGGYTGGITLPTGEIVATGTLGNVTVSGGTLKGTGTVGNVDMASGKVAPGNSPGVLNTGNLTYTGGSFDVELGGKAAGEFDQTNVAGTVKLGSATTLNIALFGSYAPAVNDSFVIINNDGTDAVEGTFKGLKDGAKVYGAYTYQINYDGGDGNDVVLLVTGNPGAPDTGSGFMMASPWATLIAAVAVAGAVAGHRFYELKKARK